MFDIALETGMRMSEIFTLTKDQVSLEQRTIFLDKSKNGTRGGCRSRAPCTK